MEEEEENVEGQGEPSPPKIDIPQEGTVAQGGEEGEEEETEWREGALLGEDDYDDDDSDSSSLLGSEEIDEEEADEEDLEEEERRRKRKRDKKRKKKKGRKYVGEDDEEEQEVLGEEEVEEEEVIDDAFGRQRMESLKRMSVKAIISGFDLDMGDDEGEEEVTESTESEPTPLIREPYYALYLKYMKNYAQSRRLNNFLHKKMAEYFKKRKMEHVLREMAEHLEEAKMKYATKLDNFQELIAHDKNQRAKVNADLKLMKKMRLEQVAAAQTALDEFIQLERNTGVGLINSKTGKEIPEKAVDKLLNNQKTKSKEIKNLRLKHIKIRNAVADKHAAIRALDRIGENYTLIEFEQMKIENAAHVDKVEEKDDELCKLRKKCSAAIQCLAHIREKCSAVEMNIRTIKAKLMKEDSTRAEARELMNELKQKRDYFRQETQRLKEVNGLLAKDKLLIDMENAMKETEVITVDIERRTKIYNVRKGKLSVLKVNYEKEKKRRSEINAFMAPSKSVVQRDPSRIRKTRKVHKGRPTIMGAVFPDFEY